MGVYLPKPKTDKESEDGGDAEITGTRFGLSAMQGWRQFMEDAHLADPKFSGGVIQTSGLFAVFDGHGGPAVSAWVASSFQDILRRELKAVELEVEEGKFELQRKELDLKTGIVCEALQRTFLNMDEDMKSSPNRNLLKTFHEEAEVMTRCGGGVLQMLFYQKKKKAAQEQLNPDGHAPEPESLLDAIIAGVGGHKPLLRVIEQDGQKFYQLLSRETVEEEEHEESHVEDLGEGSDRDDIEMTGSETSETTTEAGETEKSKKDHEVKEEVELTVGLDRASSRRSNEVEKVLDDLGRKSEEEGFLDFEHKKIDNEDEQPEDRLSTLDEANLQPYQPECCGTTAIVALLVEDVTPPVLITANAGDSRAVLCRNGIAIPLSKDHKPGLIRETQRIEKAGGKVVNGRVDGNLNLSRSIGDLFYKKDATIPPQGQKITAHPDVRITSISPQDEFVIIACDGIWDCLTNQLAVDIVSQKLKEMGVESASPFQLSKICEHICDLCISENPLESEGGIGCDNMTIMIVQFNQNLKDKGMPGTESPVTFYGPEGESLEESYGTLLP